jgi:ParB family chromosome partitioning protein
MELSDKEAFEVGLIENIQHHTMNAIEEAIAFSKYVDDFGWGGVSELARQIGKSQEYVTKRIQLLDLPEIIKGGVISRRITPSAASELLPLKNEKCLEKVGQFMLTNTVSKIQARNLVRKTRRQDKNPDHIDSVELYDSIKKTSKLSNYYDELDRIDKALVRLIVLMKSTLIDFDEIINSVNENWILTELLMDYRLIIHGDIDTFLHLRKKLKSKIPRNLANLILSNCGKVDPDRPQEKKLSPIYHSARFLT